MRQKILFDNEWLFHKGDIKIETPSNKGAVYIGAKTERYKVGPASRFYYAEVDSYELDKEYKCDKWISVNLPHDYLMDSPIDSNENNSLGFIKRENAWYIKKFIITDEDKNKRITVLFEGIAVKSTIYINGCLIKHNFSAYNSFEIDITDYVLFNEENRLVVYCDTSESEGWWYQGGGIYRHVYLIKTDLISIDLWGLYVKTILIDDNNWLLDVTTTIRNDYYKNKNIKLEISIYDAQDTFLVSNSINSKINERDLKDVNLKLEVHNPSLWSPDTPNLYYAVARIYLNNKLVDEYKTRFGFRTYYVDPNKGLFINNKKYTIYGVCGHNNGGRLFGQAVPDNIFKYRIEELKKIGINGYRTSHYMQSEYLMDVLDENGFIVMDETRWFESSEEGKEQLKALVKRDRNRPSVFFYSLGNEEPFTTTEQGRRIFKNLKSFIKKLDDTRLVTTAVSFDPSESTIFNDTDVIGINYNFESVDSVRNKNPNKGILFSEFCACGITRGWYNDDDDSKGYKSTYDKDTENIFFRAREFNYKFLNEREYMLGGYVWHAYEYNGETIWPRLSSCSGLIDLFLQKKESYYHTESLISKKPMIYLMPHWNYRGQEGREIRVVAYTNCSRVELYLNDELIGEQEVESYGHAEWKVPFKEGKLVAKGYNENGEVVECERVTTGKPYKLKLELETEDVQANGKDYAIFMCYVVDENGNKVPDAEELVRFTCNGVGEIYATGSDTSDHSSPLLSTRKMRAGSITIAVKMKDKKGKLTLIAESNNILSTYFEKEF